jgi:hypothetical protein
MARVWELDVGHAQQSVLLAMADHADDEGAEVFPSTGLIGWKTGYSKRQVQRIIDGMEVAGLLVRVAEAHGWRATEYRICFDAAAVKQSYEPSKKGRGDTMSPQVDTGPGRQDVVPTGRQDDAPDSPAGWEQMSPPGATFGVSRGDIAMSPRTIREPSKEPSVEQATSSLTPRGDLIELSNRLADGIRSSDGKAKVKPESHAWLNPLRLLVDRDGRTPGEVRDVIDWVLTDEFEHKVVLSPGKLRERFTQLALKAGVSQPANDGPIKFRRPGAGKTTARFDPPSSSLVAWLVEHPATDDLAMEWEPIRTRLAESVDAATFTSWLARLHLHASGDELVLGCDRGARKWLTDRFGRLICSAAGGKQVRIVECGCRSQEQAA